MPSVHREFSLHRWGSEVSRASDARSRECILRVAWWAWLQLHEGVCDARRLIMHARMTHARTHARTHPHTHARTHARTHAHTRTHTHARMHARMHARTHTHTCIHAHSHTRTFTFTWSSQFSFFFSFFFCKNIQQAHYAFRMCRWCAWKDLLPSRSFLKRPCSVWLTMRAWYGVKYISLNVHFFCKIYASFVEIFKFIYTHSRAHVYTRTRNDVFTWQQMRTAPFKQRQTTYNYSAQLYSF